MENQKIMNGFDSKVLSPKIANKPTPNSPFDSAPLKLGSSQLKLRQMVKKGLLLSSNLNSSKQASKQQAKQALEGTLWETLSPTASSALEGSHIVTNKAKNNPSPKLNGKSHPKLHNKKRFPLQIEVDEPKTIKMASANYKAHLSNTLNNLSLANSPKNGSIDMTLGGMNGGFRSTKNSQTNKDIFSGLFPSQPKTCTNKDLQLAKLKNFLANERDVEEDDKNLSLDDITISSPSHQTSIKNMSLKNLSIESNHLLKHDASLEKHSPTAAQGVPAIDIHKNSQSQSQSQSQKVLHPSLKQQIKKNLINKAAFIHEWDQNFGFGKENHTLDDIENIKETQISSPKNIHKAEVLKLTPKRTKVSKESIKELANWNKRDFPREISKGKRLDSRKRNINNTKALRYKATSTKNLPKKEFSYDNITEQTTINARRKDGLHKGHSPHRFNSIFSHNGSSIAKDQKRGGLDSQTFVQNVTAEYERSTENTFNGGQDTTGHTKSVSKKDGSRDESIRQTVKAKRLMRAKSHGGGGQIEEMIANLERDDKWNKINLQKQTNVAALRERIRDNKPKGSFGSFDLKELLYKNMHKGTDTTTEALTDKICSLIIDHEPSPTPKRADIIKELPLNCDKQQEVHVLQGVQSSGPENSTNGTQLGQILVRTTKMLTDYKQKEKAWQQERQELLQQIEKLKNK
jgi:hypothetical protein